MFVFQILAVQIMAGKVVADCGLQGDNCKGLFSRCCSDYYCASRDGFQCKKCKENIDMLGFHIIFSSISIFVRLIFGITCW